GPEKASSQPAPPAGSARRSSRPRTPQRLGIRPDRPRRTRLRAVRPRPRRRLAAARGPRERLRQPLRKPSQRKASKPRPRVSAERNRLLAEERPRGREQPPGQNR